MNVQLVLKVPAEPVVSGTPLRVQTVVRNTGTGPIELPPQDAPSPLTFVVRDLAGQVVASGNALDEASARLGVQGPKATPRPVSPGAEVVYDEDISGYLGRALAAGRYELVAELRQMGSVIASTSASLVIESLAPDAVVRTSDADGLSLSTLVAAHRQSDGRDVLLYTYADTSGRWKSTLRPVLDLPASSTIPTLALVPESLTDSSFAWAAALDGEALHGVLVQPYDTADSFGPVPLSIGPARLLETGVPLPGGGALLMALGQNGSTFVVILINKTGNVSLHRLQALPGMSASASIVVAAAKEVDRVYVCWVEGAKSLHALSFRAAEPELGPRSGVIYQTVGRILAIQADPPASRSPASLQIVEETASLAAPAVLTRVALDRAEAAEHTPIPSTPFSVRETRKWLLPLSAAAASGPMLVPLSGKTWMLENGTWKSIEVGMADSAGARLIRFGGSLWLSTWSPRKSLDLHRLR